MNGLRESERSMGIKVDGFERLKVPGQVKLDGQKDFNFYFCGSSTFILPDLPFSTY